MTTKQDDSFCIASEPSHSLRVFSKSLLQVIAWAIPSPNFLMSLFLIYRATEALIRSFEFHAILFNIVFIYI